MSGVSVNFHIFLQNNSTKRLFQSTHHQLRCELIATPSLYWIFITNGGRKVFQKNYPLFSKKRQVDTPFTSLCRGIFVWSKNASFG